ncbi:hypothetical protein A2U01_0003904, partial [Trifolium medium]|nr:hypothetical protein [Trifolium medium]
YRTRTGTRYVPGTGTLSKLEYPCIIAPNCMRAFVWSNCRASGGTNLLPLQSNDLANTPLEQEDLSLKAFLSSIHGIMVNLYRDHHNHFLWACFGFLSYNSNNTTNQFGYNQVTKTTINTPGSLLMFGKAFSDYLSEISHITELASCYFITWILVLLPTLQPELRKLLMVILTFSPCIFFFKLGSRASALDIYVTFGGSFKLPLIAFTSLAAVGISLAYGIIVFLKCYCLWRFTYKGRVREVVVN